MTDRPSPENVAERKKAFFKALRIESDVWVFGYGSLMWNPAFNYAERRPCLIRGWHRSFCLWTPVGRGSPENPGLVLALDRGGSCCGIAYRVAARDRETELPLLWQREMVGDGYNPRWVTLRCREGHVRAITWVINRQGERYAGRLPMETLARTLATAEGRLGSSRDYLEKTVTHLDELGIRERPLHRICDRVREYARMNGEG
ncbi:MAG: gamma-glutamylcyclotransferase [Alphaproteobacteria bacterium]|nr:gamma-glutamylcyclotransferase [Alphaproteobacteria bacterium]